MGLIPGWLRTAASRKRSFLQGLKGCREKRDRFGLVTKKNRPGDGVDGLCELAFFASDAGEEGLLRAES